MPCFVPGSDELVTTSANKTPSAQLRNCLYATLSKAAVAHFEACDNLNFQSFEMVAILRKAYDPTGNDSVFFSSLNRTAKKSCQSTWLVSVPSAVSSGPAASTSPFILFNMFTAKGLGGRLRSSKEGCNVFSFFEVPFLLSKK